MQCTLSPGGECNYPGPNPTAQVVNISLSPVTWSTGYWRDVYCTAVPTVTCTNSGLLSGYFVRSISQLNLTSLHQLTRYVLTPSLPFETQQFAISLRQATYTDAEALNTTGDVVRIISGSLFDCGYSNTSSVVELSLNSSAIATYTINTSTTTNLTVCYKKYNGTFATVPRDGAGVDYNLRVANLYPKYYSAVPVYSQVSVSLNITFYSNSSGPLSSSDSAALVPVLSPSSAPIPADCDGTPSLVSGTITVTSSTTSVWRIAAAQNLFNGTFAVCYTVATNGKRSYVPNPGYLVITPRQSPFGFFTDSPGQRTIYEGERVHCTSNNESLNPALTWNATTTSDQVLFAQTRRAPLRDSVWCVNDPISFGYLLPPIALSAHSISYAWVVLYA